MTSITRIFKRLGQQGLQLGLLALVIGLTGVGVGLAAAYPISRIQFEESDAIRLDQARLAGTVDPANALTTLADLPQTEWAAGDPAVASFGLLGTDFCGEAVKLPTALSPKQAVVFTNASDESILISETIRVDTWQSAKEYVEDVGRAVGECDEFYRTDLAGARVQVDIKDGMGDPPITDYVSKTFVTSDGSGVQVWSMMAVGDVVVSTQYVGPERPQQTLMDNLEGKILLRVAPETFAPGGLATDDTTPTTISGGTETTLIEGGAADESPDATGATPTTAGG